MKNENGGVLPVPVIEILAVGTAAFQGAGESLDVARVIDGLAFAAVAAVAAGSAASATSAAAGRRRLSVAAR